jgi:hypothetical protein
MTGFEAKHRRPTGGKGFSGAGFCRKEIFYQAFVAQLDRAIFESLLSIIPVTGV